MNIKEIITLLKKNEQTFLTTKSYSELPGIYALFYIGNKFPILGESVSKHQIIYIGKTESSQQKRNAKTHFAIGKTGSSTVRKSIGSILYDKEKLKSIPRNESDYNRGRFSHFKFDLQSEKTITKWMENNLSLAFYEFLGSRKEIEELETKIITELVPILNISKNSKNPFRKTLQQLRKNCAIIAINNFEPKILSNQNSISPVKIKPSIGNSAGKYIDLWTKYSDSIIDSLINVQIKKSIQLDSEAFHLAGSRKQYSFNLELRNGIVLNNINGSALARDLSKVLLKSNGDNGMFDNAHYKINLDKEFCLWVEKF